MKLIKPFNLDELDLIQGSGLSNRFIQTINYLIKINSSQEKFIIRPSISIDEDDIQALKYLYELNLALTRTNNMTFIEID